MAEPTCRQMYTMNFFCSMVHVQNIFIRKFIHVTYAQQGCINLYHCDYVYWGQTSVVELTLGSRPRQELECTRRRDHLHQLDELSTPTCE